MSAIARSGQKVDIVGEQGLVLRSDDAGASYSAVPGPYTTSLFCVAVAGNGDVLLGGLRGTAFVSTDQGYRFDALSSVSQGGCANAVRVNDGGLLVGNQLGQLLRYAAHKQSLKLMPMPPMAPLSGLLATWAFSPIKFQADMGILLAFMFMGNMVAALVLLPALAHFLLPAPVPTSPIKDIPNECSAAIPESVR